MKRIMATVLAAAAAVVAFGGAASASTADGTTKFKYRSANHRAVVEGAFTVPQPGYHIYGLSFALSDRDYRTARHGGKCAYVEINYATLTPGAEGPYTSTYTQCGAGTDKQISSGIIDLRYLYVKVCQIREKGTHPVNCGRRHLLFAAAP